MKQPHIVFVGFQRTMSCVCCFVADTAGTRDSFLSSSFVVCNYRMSDYSGRMSGGLRALWVSIVCITAFYSHPAAI